MAKIFGGQAMGRVLKEEGVEYIFGVHGGHNWSIISAAVEQGIKLIHMRHEQTGSYAADAYARVTRKPAICTGTAGPGMTNMLTGIAQAYWCGSPVIALLGQHSIIHDHRGALQESYGAEVYKSLTKWSERMVEWSMLSSYLKKAFRDALRYRPGPVALEYPVDRINRQDDEEKQIAYVPFWLKRPSAAPAGDPKLIEETALLLTGAKAPVIVAGDGVYWSRAEAELVELAEFLQIPVNTRRMGRGAFPEDHPLALGAGYRGGFLRGADLIVVIGLRLGYLEAYGQWGEKARYIQINEDPGEIETSRTTEIEIIGSPRLVLKQLIDCLKSRMKQPKEGKEIKERIAEARKRWEQRLAAEEDKTRYAKPIHPAWLCREVLNFLDNSATIIYDSYTATQYMTDRVKAKFGGQILEASEFGSIGQGIGMGIGAQLARPGKQVFVLMGDGGMGVGGMDIETAQRYNLPAVYLIYNNSTWLSGMERVFYGELLRGNTFGMLPNIRYDKMFEPLGCHTEHVENPEQLRPALERSFASGKTAVVNVFVDEKARHRMFQSPMAPILVSMLHHMDLGKMPEEGRKVLQEGRETLGWEYF